MFILQVITGLILFFRDVRLKKYLVLVGYLFALIFSFLKVGFLPGLTKEIFEISFGMLLYLIIYEDKTIRYIAISLVLLGMTYIFTISILYLVWVSIFIIIEFCVIPLASFVKKYFAFLGSLSFYWYLVHQNIGYSVIYNILPESAHGVIWLLIPLFTTIIIAFFVSKTCWFIEQRLMPVILIKAKGDKRNV